MNAYNRVDLITDMVFDASKRINALTSLADLLNDQSSNMSAEQVAELNTDLKKLEAADAISLPSSNQRHSGQLTRLLSLVSAAKSLKEQRLPVALVVMPFASIWYASIGVSILQSALRAADIECKVIYLNIDFAEEVGFADYDAIGVAAPPTALTGEWAFQESQRTSGEAGRRYIEEVIIDRHGEHFNLMSAIQLGRVRQKADEFLIRAACDPFWEKVDVVGFTTTFQQNLSSIRLAGLINERHPNTPIVFGGANTEGEMGEELLRQFPWISSVFQGESEITFPEQIRQFIDKKSSGSEDVGIPATVAGTIAPDMNAVPAPSYTDYVERKSQSSLPSGFAIPYETSRGCWWGAKRHCTFCGLNGATMAYRSKDADRVLKELTDLVAEAGSPKPAQIVVVDNILDYDYFDTLLPLLTKSDLNVELHFEVKANLSRSQVERLKHAGVAHLQPGIESLSDHVLRLMRKGTTALKNIETLKWCSEVGIHVSWNYLHGFPGETQADYDDVIDVIKLVEHLSPPQHVGRARADRFSPFFETPEELGVKSVSPEPAYDFVYGDLGPEAVNRLAYHFSIDAEATVGDGTLTQFKRSIEDWQRNRESTLTARWADGTLWATDARSNSVSHDPQPLAHATGRVLFAIDVASPLEKVKAAVPELTDRAVRTALTELTDRGFAFNKGKHYLGLPVLERHSLPPEWMPKVAARRRIPLAVSG